MLSNVTRTYALAGYTVEKCAKGWHFWPTRHHRRARGPSLFFKSEARRRLPIGGPEVVSVAR